LPDEGISPDDGGYPITGVVKSLDWKARNLKIFKKYNLKDAQTEVMDAIIDECLAKIATYLS